MNILRAIDVTKVYGKKVVIKKMNFFFERGSKIAVSGKNGSGKSTLLKLMAGLVLPTYGEIERLDRLRYGIVSPEINPYNELTVAENVSFIEKSTKVSFDIHFFEQFSLTEFLNVPAGELSSGFYQRLKISLACGISPDVLFLDEPGLSLDNDGMQVLCDILSSRSDCSVMLASNEESELSFADTRIHVG